jgi:valyl-tRNA synthetase
MFNKRQQNDFFILCPPPNVTGSLHIGHALTFAIQNCFAMCHQVFKNQNSFLILGFDHGGISTTYIAKKIYDNPTFEQIQEVAMVNKESIARQFKLLKLIAKPEIEGYTMDDFHYKLVQEAFIKFYKDGLIFKKEMVVAYDTHFKTTVSDLEIETKEENGFLYTVPYLLENDETIEVCTSRPETIFADEALCVNPNDQRYKHLIGKKARIPIYGKWIPIISHSNVDMDFGSGVLKITPAHSIADFEIAEERGITGVNVIDTNGRLTFKNLKNISEAMRKYEGMHCSVVRHMIGDMYKKQSIKQQIPYSSKSNSVIEYLLTEQWFFNVKSGAEMALKRDLRIEPDIWKNNYTSWLKSINPLWCISRQIPWGHQIPVWYKNDQMQVCIESPGDAWVQDNNVLDTWFSSALWPMRYKMEHNLYPCDILVTAYDILFFWVARMVMVSLMYDGTMPFKSVLIHGLVRDDRGRKMSKTSGNVLDPIDVMQANGGYDVLSLGLLHQVVPNGNVCFGSDAIQRARTIITKITNAVEFYGKKNIQKNSCDSCCPVECIIEHDRYKETGICEHFLYLLQKQEKEYDSYLQNLQLHMMLSSTLEFLYTVCDFLIEFTKHVDGLLNVLKICLNGCIRMLYGFIPDTCKHLWTLMNDEDILSVEYEHQQNHIKQEKIENLILVIKRIRSFVHFGVSICSDNQYVQLISKMCHVQIKDIFNCTIFGYKLFIENRHLVNDAIFKINRKIDEIDNFFNKCDTSKIPQEILETKKDNKEKLVKERDELYKLV